MPVELPPPEEVAPDVWRVSTPLGGFLRSVHAYVLRDAEGYVLVDTGLETEETWAPLAAGLAQIGAPVHAFHTIVVTHGHHDHFGQAGRVRQASGGEVWLHQADLAYMHHRFVDRATFPAQLSGWLQQYGVPAEEARGLSQSDEDARRAAAIGQPDRLLAGGETLRVGRYAFEVQWTPGHTPGHVLLYDHAQQLLLCGDHILPHVSPNVSIQAYAPDANPLPRYLDSLRQLASADIRLALPGHGEPMASIGTRAASLLRHQLERQAQLLSLMAAEPRTPYQLAAELWRDTQPNNWSQFRGHVRRNAVSTTVAHLELLADDGRVRRVTLATDAGEQVGFARR